MFHAYISVNISTAALFWINSDLGLAVVTKVKIKGYAGTPGYTGMYHYLYSMCYHVLA